MPIPVHTQTTYTVHTTLAAFIVKVYTICHILLYQLTGNILKITKADANMLAKILNDFI